MKKTLKSSEGNRISMNDVFVIEGLMQYINVHRIFMYLLLSVGLLCISVVCSVENMRNGGRLAFASCLLFLVACCTLLISVILSYEAVRSLVARYRLYKLDAYTTSGVIIGTSACNAIQEFSADCKLKNGSVVSAYVGKTIWEDINFDLENECTVAWVNGFEPFILKVMDKK